MSQVENLITGVSRNDSILGGEPLFFGLGANQDYEAAPVCTSPGIVLP